MILHYERGNQRQAAIDENQFLQTFTVVKLKAGSGNPGTTDIGQISL